MQTVSARRASGSATSGAGSSDSGCQCWQDRLSTCTHFSTHTMSTPDDEEERIEKCMEEERMVDISPVSNDHDEDAQLVTHDELDARSSRKMVTCRHVLFVR